MIHRSPYPDVTVPDQSVTEYVLGRLEGLEQKVALIDGPSDQRITYGALVSSIRRVAGELVRRGLRKGDVVAIYSPNDVMYPVAFHGVALAGGTLTTVNPTYVPSELARQLRDARARFLVTMGPFLESARAAAEEAGGIEVIFSFDGAAGTTAFADLMEGEPLATPVEIDPANDLVALPYSSGTTGVSKGVMLTHRNLVANMQQMRGTDSRCRPITDADTLIAVLPFFHIYGLTVIMNYALSKGATIVVVPRFDLQDFLRVIQEYRVTFVYLVPPILVALAKHPLVDEFDLSSLDGLNSGAAPLGADLARAVENRLGCFVTQGYGLTETSPVTHMSPNLEPDRAPHATIGACLPNTEVMIVDVATGEPLPTGEPGELWIRGPQVMQGYLGQPEATARTLDAEGWLHTGDVGCVDDQGYCTIVDRVKELIKFKGFQVAPAELEALLLSHPAVRDVAVVRSPDEEAGEVPKAFVVSDGSLSDEDVMGWVAERVSPHKKIRRVEFVDEIPKSPSGKILRRVLIEREARASEATP